MAYLCEFCKRTFATTYALKRHVSDKHQYEKVETSRSNPPREEDIWGDVEPSGSRSNPPHEEDIWGDVEPSGSRTNPPREEDVDPRSTSLYNEPGILDVDFMMEDKTERLPEISDSEDGDDCEMEGIDNNLTFPLSIDDEDYCGTSLDDAIKDKMHPPNTEWPNDIYREFMEIVMEFQLSNACGDKIIKLIDKSRQDKNPLPKSTREGRKFLDINEFPYMKFKTVSITNFQDTDYKFYYQPIIHGIKVLLLQSDINREFVYKYRNADVLRDKIYGEQFESDW
jgi:hypothetical protein